MLSTPTGPGSQIWSQDQDIFDTIYWLMDTPSSADLINNFLCTSAGTRNVKFPLYFFNPKGSGISSFSSFIHATAFPTTFSISLNALSIVLPCAASYGNSRHLAICN